MKKLLLFVTIFLCIPLFADAQVNVSAQSAVLINGNTGDILFEADAFTPRPIASLTKIMTAIIALEATSLEDVVTISEEAAGQEPSSCPLTAGDQLTMRDLLKCLLLQSGNDAAWAIAEHVAGNVDDFVQLMNDKARSLNLEQTTFSNPSGLDEPSSNMSTAYDLAKLTQYAMTNDQFREISGEASYSTTTALGIPLAWAHKHRLVRNIDWVVSGKTGFTSRAGRTLISVAEVDGVQLIAVTLNDANDWDDHIAMFEYGFGQFGINVTVPEDYLRGEPSDDERD